VTATFLSQTTRIRPVADLRILFITLRASYSCGAVYCNRSCLWVCNGRAVSEPYYSQRAQCLRFSERFFIYLTNYTRNNQIHNSSPSSSSCGSELASKLVCAVRAPGISSSGLRVVLMHGARACALCPLSSVYSPARDGCGR